MLDARIRFRHLRTFVEVARQRSIGGAARVLNVTQPAVSKTMRELEVLLGATLVDREGRGIRLTHTGEVFLRHAGAALAALQTGIESVGGTDRGPSVRVGALPTVLARIMPAAIALFLAEGTDSPLRIVSGDNAILLDQLRRAELDLVVGRLAAPERMAGLTFSHLYSEQVRLVVRPGHPLLAEKQFDFAAIRGFPVLMPPQDSVIRPTVDRFLLSQGEGPYSHAIETVSHGFGRVFVAESDAIWIISEGVIAREIDNGQLALLPVDTTDTKGAVGLTLPQGTPANASVDILCATIRETVRTQDL